MPASMTPSKHNQKTWSNKQLHSQYALPSVLVEELTALNLIEEVK